MTMEQNINKGLGLAAMAALLAGGPMISAAAPRSKNRKTAGEIKAEERKQKKRRQQKKARQRNRK